jgi:hypothetical protein
MRRDILHSSLITHHWREAPHFTLPHDRNALSRFPGLACGSGAFFLRAAALEMPSFVVIFGVIPSFFVRIISLAQAPSVVVPSPLACKILRMWPFRPRRLKLAKLPATGGKSSQISPQRYPQREASFALQRQVTFAKSSSRPGSPLRHDQNAHR